MFAQITSSKTRTGIFKISTTAVKHIHLAVSQSKMFQLKPYDEPAEPSFPHDLQALNLIITSDGQVVKADGEPFPRRPHKNERLSMLHFEAIRGGIRECVMQRCLEYDVKPVFVRGVELSDTAGEQPSVQILTSERKGLRKKRTVIVLIGPSTGDLGILSHFSILHGGGIIKHSILDLLGKLSKQRLSENMEILSDDTPGLLLLNSGQLIYSHELKINFSRRSWLARPLPKGQRAPYTIHPDLNLIPGHENAYAHLKTSFEHIIPKLVRLDTSLCIIAIGDTTGVTLNVLDDLLISDPQHPIGKQLAMSFLMQPNHGYAEIHSPLLRKHLAQHAQAFVMDDHAIGTLLQEPPAFTDEKDNLQDRLRARPKLDLPVPLSIPLSSERDAAASAKQESDENEQHADQQEDCGGDSTPELITTGPPSNLPPVICNETAKDDVTCVTLSAGPGVVNPDEILTTPAVLSHVLHLIHNLSTAD